jgi:hypothetical protein
VYWCYIVAKKEEKKKSALEEAGFEEEAMEIRLNFPHENSGFPKSIKRYRMWREAENLSVEEMYYWLLTHLTTDWGLTELDKITDIMAASSSSSIFGDMQARLTAQQNQANQLLGTIGRMVKDLFQIVRELRQLRERVGYYQESKDWDKKSADAAEKTLKGIWIDLVEGGTQNPSSVIGLAQKVGYSILPDLFFNSPPMKENGVTDYVDSLEFNSNVKNMLKRKIFQFLRWKKETYTELVAKRNFQIRYLRQHFDSIRMYMNWVKPYLKQIEMLQLQHGARNDHGISTNKAHMDSAFLINSFQGALTEIETLAYRKGSGKYFACVHIHIFHRTMPSLDYHAKDSWQQKGPIHIGRTEMALRAYVWTREEIESYKKLKQKEDWGLLMNIDKSLMDAMELLGEDLVEFLKDADLELPEGFAKVSADKQKDKKDLENEGNILEPFIGLFGGLKDIFGPLIPINTSDLKFSFGEGHKNKVQALKDLKDKKATTKFIKNCAWNTYKNYKKSQGMVTW